MKCLTIKESNIPSMLIFFILMSVTVAGCGLMDADTEEPLQELETPEVELIPLEVGNYWIYDQWHIEPTWRDTVRNEVLNVRDVILENTRVRAYGTHRYRYDQQPREDAIISLAANGPEGYYSLGFDAPLDTLNKITQRLLYKYPATVGDSWELTAIRFNVVEQKLRHGETRTITLVDTSKTIETPAGTFENCFVYVYNDFGIATLLYHHIYIKPTVGLIGLDTFEADNPNDTSVLYGQQRLIEYKVNHSHMTGKEVARLVNGSLPAEYHRVTWDAGGLPSGIYLYGLTANDFEETGRMALVK